MSVITRINRATNPNLTSTATGYASFAGTGGTATGSRVSAAGWDGSLGYFRVTWSAATTAVSGGAVYTGNTGLSASTQYTHSLYVRPSVTQTMRISAQYRDASNANIGGTTFGANTSCPANVWTRLSVTATSPAGAVDRVALTPGATTGGVNWASGNTVDIDAVLIETGSAVGSYFDGSYTASAGSTYSWLGTVDGSNSQVVTYVPSITLVPLYTGGCDRVQVTIADLSPGPNRVTIWRTADGKRQAVRGYRRVEVVGSDTVDDFEAPLWRTLTYELEILEGSARGATAAAVQTTLQPPGPKYGWIQDPLDPTSAIKLYGDLVDGSETTLMDEAIKNLEYAADISIIPIMGSPDPVALLGQRMSASGVSFKMSTNAAQQASDLRNLMKQAPLVLIRTIPEWGAALPGLCYIAPPTPAELPVNEAWGGQIIEWKIETPLVAAPSMAVVVVLWSYGDVEALWDTYQQAQSALSGKTYLQVRKSPATG